MGQAESSEAIEDSGATLELLLPSFDPVQINPNNLENYLTIQLASDVHLEFPQVKALISNVAEEDGKISRETNIIEAKGEVLGLLGDIGDPFSLEYEQFVMEQAEKFKIVFIVTGNHEYYRNIISETDQRIMDICKKKDNLVFLNKSSFVYENESGKRIRFVGGTLWTNVPLKERSKVEYSMNDYRRIKTNSEKCVTISETIEMHERLVEYIRKECEKHPEETIAVLTHHSPFINGTVLEDEMFLASGMATNLDHIIKQHSNISFWGFGHTHRNSFLYLDNPRVTDGKTVLVSNQLGYIIKKEDTVIPYSKDLVFHIPLLNNQ
ncbi:predicted protein [Naegleria gruberi]|uniref:Predicted protein n=1 Tax=Naegleria gruberi TaxID=5762 RepID=D2VUK2_NAEGR|nr:uncharacterized protein NAEGRDRAFT_52372 [Naegleria gruberi]EFC39525.1 predicted protein [Naegleria gruberi]|eukprot:XP_002672269.1 predicted protein [Naegleria gruberi strain NEG-M]